MFLPSLSESRRHRRQTTEVKVLHTAEERTLHTAVQNTGDVGG